MHVEQLFTGFKKSQHLTVSDVDAKSSKQWISYQRRLEGLHAKQMLTDFVEFVHVL